MSAKSRKRARDRGERKLPNESKQEAYLRAGVEIRENESRPWREPLRRVLGRKRREIETARREGRL